MSIRPIRIVEDRNETKKISLSCFGCLALILVIVICLSAIFGLGARIYHLVAG